MGLVNVSIGIKLDGKCCHEYQKCHSVTCISGSIYPSCLSFLHSIAPIATLRLLFASNHLHHIRLTLSRFSLVWRKSTFSSFCQVALWTLPIFQHFLNFLDHFLVYRTQLAPASSRFLATFHKPVQLLLWSFHAASCTFFCTFCLTGFFSKFILLDDALLCPILFVRIGRKRFFSFKVICFLGEAVQLWDGKGLIGLNFQWNFLAVSDKTHHLAIVTHYFFIFLSFSMSWKLSVLFRSIFLQD